ncbi:MAG: hypothetical protein GX829_04830 [Clostridium sp.]|nr:hypothetical protein [Clostridium sp.]
MKYKKYREAMKLFWPEQKTKERMLNQIMDNSQKKNRSFITKNRAMLSLGLLALIILVATNLGSKSSDVDLFRDENLIISKVDKVPQPEGNPGAITAIYTQEDVFSLFPIHGFRGEVKSIQNIAIEDNFGITYGSYAVIKVNSVYKGDLNVGDEVKVLLPGPIEDGEIIGVDFNITRGFITGEEGIFLPVVNEDLSSSLRKFTKYSLYDSTRFAFIMTQDGLDFNKDTFSDLSQAKTLDDVEKYVRDKLDQ